MQDILIRTTDDWKTALDLGHVVAIVMIDLSKAFDTINHELLIVSWKHMVFVELNHPGFMTTYLGEDRE